MLFPYQYYYYKPVEASEEYIEKKERNMVDQKKKISARLLSAILTVMMVVTLMPAALLSETENVSAATVSAPRVTSSGTTWDCVYFGSYPQTEIVAEASQCGTYGNSYWGLSSDYAVDAGLYEKLQNASYDSNGDTTVNGIKYRRIKKSDATYGTSGSSNYYSWSDSTTYHYFRYDKIKWRVLETSGGYALLLADKALDDQRYNTAYTSITWEKSTIRSWLNGYDAYGTDYTQKNFINSAFSSSEQSAIKTAEVINDNNIQFGTAGGNDTEDKVFLLAESDVWNTDKAVSHGFNRAYSAYDKARRSKSTTYAKAMGTWSNTDSEYAGNCWWWLRSPGSYSKSAAYAYHIGAVSTYGYSVDDDDGNHGVRPALYLNLSSTIWSKAGTVSSEGSGTEDNKNTGSAGITEEQLYGEYCRYLSNNPAYKQMLGEVYADLDDIIYVSDDKATIAARSTALKNGVFANLKAIFGALTGKSYTEREYEEAVASDLLTAIAEDEYLMAEITEKVKKQYKATSDTYKLISNGYKTAAAYNAYAVGFANNYSQDEILQVIESVNKNWESIGKVFDAAGVAVNAIETAVTVIIARDTDIYTMDKISGAIDKDSALHNGLKRISNKKKGTTGDALVTEWIKNDAFEFVADKIIKLGSGAIGVVELGYRIIGYFEGLNSDGADMEDIDKGFIALSNDAQIRSAVNDIIYNMALQNQNGGNKDYSEDFKFFKQAQFTAIDECVKYANKIGTAKQKKKLNSDYNKYKSLFNIDSYIKSCLANANADWKYKVVDGKAVITGIQKDSTASANAFSSIADRLGLVAYADDENDVMNVLVIPDKIDDYEVTGIDSSAFANDTDIEFAYIPGSVNAIGESAFEGCSNLKAVFFDRGIETIDANAFADCNGLDSVSIPASVTTIDNNAFSGNEELTVYAAKGTEGEAYAESGSATYEAVEPEVTELKVENLPSKTTYKMSEEDVDTTGLKVTATFETGDTKDVTGEVYCCFDDKQLGTSKVIVAYGTDETTFDVTIEADECTYTVSYEDELGNELAEKVSGKAMAGTEVTLDVKDINGYVPIEDEQTVTIGQYNDFVVLYSAEPPKDIANAEVEEIGDAFYTGSSQTPKLTVSFNGKQLTEGEDYSVAYDENIAIGEGKAMIIGSGDYGGTKEVSFNIVSQPLKADKVSLSSSSYTYSGGVKTPSVKVTDISGNTLSKGKDYTVSYQSGRKYVSTYKVVVKGIGNYSGSVTKTFNINPQGTYITKLSKGTKRFTVKWKKRTTQITGYQVRYSTSSSMAGAKTTTITKYKTTSKTIKKLKAKKKYYVQVRTYKTVSGKKYYSGWSSRKYVKTR